MKNFSIQVSGSCLVASLLTTGLAFAQAVPPSEATATPLTHCSALTGYQSYAEPSLRSWREVNDEVGRIGGWRTYAQEVNAKTPAQQEPSTNSHAPHHTGNKP